MPSTATRASSPEVQMLPVTDLQVDEAIRPRESLNTFVIDEYATLYTDRPVFKGG